jgi:uncharacterized protein (DUF983 family)
MNMPVSIATAENERPLTPAVMNGLKGKCPCCGKGRLFRAYLKTVDTCEVCGTEIHHHRADDLPPYLAILIVGHLLIGIMIELDVLFHIAPITYLMVMVPLGIVLPLAIIQPIKGAVVGLQWSRRMHGFGTGRDPAAPDRD